ncbi:HAMP domain-containing protein [Saccharothrix variisporea]|uniref:HAMP domain-containing protein n=1 Tax=Saccharothrix variisporea TaxID=543527 RepID=UPI000EAB8E2A|nr:HAMP domain-containing protein [Saccharothrix variisporea]
MRRLREQLPEHGFLSAVRSLPALLLVLLLAVAVTTGVLLGRDAEEEVPAAFRDSQLEIALGVARSIGATASQSLGDLRTASVGAGDKPDQALDALVRNRRWRGAAVLSGTGRTLVAARGEQVPVQAVPAQVDGAAVASTVAANGEAVLVAATALPDGRLLVATSAVRLPEPDADQALRQSFVLTTLSGKVVGAVGPLARDRAPAVDRLVADAARAASGGSGVLLGDRADRVQPTFAYARVTPSSSPDSLDLAVVAVADGRLFSGSSGASGVLPAALLALVAVAGFLVVRRVVTSPVLAARSDLLSLAAGDLDTEVRPARTAEVARVVAAADLCLDRLTGGTGQARPVTGRRPTVRATAGVLAASVFAWSAGMLVVYRSAEVEIPDTVVASVRTQTAKATEALRRSMNDGLADLAAVADGGGSRDTLRAALAQVMAGQTRYRSLYLVDPAGRVETSHGRPPLRTGEPPAKSAGLRQQNQTGRVPVIFAEVPLKDGSTLIGEFDLDHLGGLLRQVPGNARLVDGEFRTISATEGFIAFEQVDDQAMRDSAARAGRGAAVSAVHPGEDGPGIFSAAAVQGGEVGKLGWTVVAEKPGAELALPVNQSRRHAQLVALMAALVALFGYGWLTFSVLGPLRRVARAADRLVRGDFGSVIYPQRHDEVGTIASCLEICRQAVTQGHDRLGEVRRPRGAATDPTRVMEPVATPARPTTPARPATPATTATTRTPVRRPPTSARTGKGVR